ncbi:MAG: hypothetical protein ACI856_001364, partial [Kiritimatiellia bacterium]
YSPAPYLARKHGESLIESFPSIARFHSRDG